MWFEWNASIQFHVIYVFPESFHSIFFKNKIHFTWFYYVICFDTFFFFYPIHSCSHDWFILTILLNYWFIYFQVFFFLYMIHFSRDFLETGLIIQFIYFNVIFFFQTRFMYLHAFTSTCIFTWKYLSRHSRDVRWLSRFTCAVWICFPHLITYCSHDHSHM